MFAGGSSSMEGFNPVDTIARATYVSVAVLAAAQLLAQSAVLPATRVEVRSLEDFRLPPKSVFDRAMPRYPNVWFFVDAGLTTSHDAAVRLVTDKLRETMRLREDFGPFDNPEGCDFEVRLEHLQPWLDKKTPASARARVSHALLPFGTVPAEARCRRTQNGGRRVPVVLSLRGECPLRSRALQPESADVESCPVCGGQAHTGT